MIIDILTAFAVVVSIGVLFGILLALFIHLFGIEDDPKTKKLKSALPGANCGACGFNGCNDYAEALAKGKAKANLCVPGGAAVASEIGEILGVSVEAAKNSTAFVHCNGTCDAAAAKAVYDGVESCKASSMIFGGPKACTHGCLGCGDCAKACLFGAICIEDGIARINRELCKGCGICVKECPRGLISIVPQDMAAAVYCSSKDKGADARKACKNACIGCKKCEKTCPSEAISVVNNCAVIDYSKCSGFGSCAEACPTGCLKSISSKS